MQDLKLSWGTPILRKKTGKLDMASGLRELILENETPERAHPRPPQDSHGSLFESSFDFHNWPDSRCAEFKAWFFREVGEVVQYCSDYSAEQMNQMRFGCHCWFHITRAGGHFPPHNHAMAAWSAIFCVDPGDEDVSEAHNSGRVTFFDPRGNANMYLDPANRHWRPEMTFNSTRFRLSPAELVVFPSYVSHSIEPYQGERPRITIAANFWFRREQAQ